MLIDIDKYWLMWLEIARYCPILANIAQCCPILCNIVQNCQILPNIFQYFSNGYFSSLYSELVSIHYLLHVTCYLLATCYLLYVTCYMLLATCYLLHVTCCMLLIVIWYLQSDFFPYDPGLFEACFFLQKQLLPFAPVVRLALVILSFILLFSLE